MQSLLLATFSHSGREESSRPPRRKQDRPKSGGPDVDSIVSKQPEKIATPSPNHHILILNDKGEWKERITSSQRITCTLAMTIFFYCEFVELNFFFYFREGNEISRRSMDRTSI